MGRLLSPVGYNALTGVLTGKRLADDFSSRVFLSAGSGMITWWILHRIGGIFREDVLRQSGKAHFVINYLLLLPITHLIERVASYRPNKRSRYSPDQTVSQQREWLMRGIYTLVATVFSSVLTRTLIALVKRGKLKFPFTKQRFGVDLVSHLIVVLLGAHVIHPLLKQVNQKVEQFYTV